MSAIIEKTLIASIVFLAFIPFDQLFHARLGFATFGVYDLLYISIILLSFFLIGLRGVQKSGLFLFFLWMSIVIVYFTISVFVYSNPISSVIRQLRFFTPFLCAIILLAAPISGDQEKIFEYVTHAIGMGALTSIVIYVAFPEFLLAAISADEQSVQVAEAGRLYWSNDLLVFFAMLHFIAKEKKSAFLLAMITASLVATILMLSRTTILLLPIFYLIAYAHVNKKIAKPFFIIGVFAIFSAFLIFTLADDRFYNLVNLRFFGHGDLEVVYENAVLINRVSLYIQYYEILRNSFPEGQGLGLPLSQGFYDVYTTDISLLSFILPFGLPGLIVFFAFFIKTWQSSKKIQQESKYLKIISLAFPILLIFNLLLSFNVDVFSRNNSVVFIAFFSNLLLGRKFSVQASARLMKNRH